VSHRSQLEALRESERRKLGEVQDTSRRLSLEVEEVRAEVARQRETASLLFQSRSWRWTAPLRALRARAAALSGGRRRSIHNGATVD
jgi:hypothetical protein